MEKWGRLEKRGENKVGKEGKRGDTWGNEEYTRVRNTENQGKRISLQIDMKCVGCFFLTFGDLNPRPKVQLSLPAGQVPLGIPQFQNLILVPLLDPAPRDRLFLQKP